MSDDFVYPYFYQCPFCNKAAFYYAELPDTGDVVQSKFAMQIKGKPSPGDAIKCQYCEELIPQPLSSSRLKKRNEN